MSKRAEEISIFTVCWGSIYTLLTRTPLYSRHPGDKPAYGVADREFGTDVILNIELIEEP